MCKIAFLKVGREATFIEKHFSKSDSFNCLKLIFSLFTVRRIQSTGQYARCNRDCSIKNPTTRMY